MFNFNLTVTLQEHEQEENPIQECFVCRETSENEHKQPLLPVTQKWVDASMGCPQDEQKQSPLFLSPISNTAQRQNEGSIQACQIQL